MVDHYNRDYKYAPAAGLLTLLQIPSQIPANIFSKENDDIRVFLSGSIQPSNDNSVPNYWSVKWCFDEHYKKLCSSACQGYCTVGQHTLNNENLGISTPE